MRAVEVRNRATREPHDSQPHSRHRSLPLHSSVRCEFRIVDRVTYGAEVVRDSCEQGIDESSGV